jgi:hypothetical protein
MIITFDGASYDFDPSRISIDEWRELKRKYKMTPKQWQDGVSEADPDAMTMLWLAMRRQAGTAGNMTLGDHVKVDILALHDALSDAQDDEPEPEPEPEPDPTRGSSSPAASPASAFQQGTPSPGTEAASPTV